MTDPATPVRPTSEAVIFELPVSVVQQDIDGLGHANNVVYLRWAQEAAIAHWRRTSTEQQQTDYAWVAIRHEIDYLRPAFLGDQLLARTYVGSVTGVRFERFVEIVRSHDSLVLAKCRSVWVAVDPATTRPKRIDPAVNRLFFAETWLERQRD